MFSPALQQIFDMHVQEWSFQGLQGKGPKGLGLEFKVVKRLASSELDIFYQDLGPWKPFTSLPLTPPFPLDFAQAHAHLRPYLQRLRVLEIAQDWKRWCVQEGFYGRWRVVARDILFFYAEDDDALSMQQKLPPWLQQRLLDLQHCLIPNHTGYCLMGNLEISLPSTHHARLNILE